MYLIYSKDEIVRATLGLVPCFYDVKVVTGRFDYLVRLIFDDSYREGAAVIPVFGRLKRTAPKKRGLLFGIE